MTRRRREKLGEENHDRWLVSYADFITLLFAFFVVMYSISSVNEGKYRVLSDTLSDVFGQQKQRGGDQVVELPGLPVRDMVVLPDPLPVRREEVDPEVEELKKTMAEEAVRAMRQAVSQQRVYDELAVSLQSFIERDLVELSRDGNRIKVDMKARMLFSSGDARLSDQALTALRHVSQSLLRIRNPIQVEGHTDDVPISNFLYRSNWELSAARAASVVQYLTELGVEPRRLAAVGMGEHRPIGGNDTEEGRARNRRVTLMILGAEPELFDADQIVPWAEGPAVVD